MSDLVNVFKNAMNVTKADIHVPYTKVIVICGEVDTQEGTTIKQYEAGTDDGLTLEVNCPWGTQAMANSILSDIQNQCYKPYTVTSALLDPSAELGDAVNTNAVFGGLYSQRSTFGHGFYSDYSAPEDEQMNHEYKYESQTERRITRETNNTKAFFRATTQEIEAEVSTKVAKEGGAIEEESFGWKLLDNSFTLYSNGTAVFTCSKDGLTVNGNGTFSGTITAKAGRIGAKSDGTGGFYLTENKFYTDGYDSYSKNANGVYIGTDGIGLGGKFYVTKAGKLTATDVDISGKISASSGSFKGNLTVDSITFSSGVTISGSNITDGSIADGKISGISGGKVGSGIAGGNITDGTVSSGKITDGAVSNEKLADGSVSNGKIGNGAVSKTKTSSNVQSSLDNGDAAKAVVDSITANSISTYNISVSKITATNGYITNCYIKTSGFNRKLASTVYTIDGTQYNLVTWS